MLSSQGQEELGEGSRCETQSLYTPQVPAEVVRGLGRCRETRGAGEGGGSR